MRGKKGNVSGLGQRMGRMLASFSPRPVRLLTTGQRATMFEALESRAMLAVNTWSGTLPAGVTTWNTGDVEQLTGTLTVPVGSTLVIQPGTIVQGGNYAGLSIVVEGTLTAQGTAQNNILFTSSADTAGANSTQGTGSVGQWNGLVFSAGSTGTLDHVRVRYAGGSVAGIVDNDAASLIVTNSVISDAYRAGVRINGGTPTLTGNTFANNGDAAIAMDLASTPIISGSTLTSNGVNGVALDGGTINVNNSWNNPSISYWMWGSVVVAAGKTLTVGAGQVVKSYRYQSYEITVNGTLNADGTAANPIVFTSTDDDTAGGDTNNNGGNSVPAQGQWNGIAFSATSTGNLLDNVQVRYGGGSTTGAIVVNGAPLTLTNSVVSNSYRAGVRINGATPTLTGNTFANNGEAAVAMDLASTPIISGSTLTNNGVNGVALDGGTINANNSWNNPSISYWMWGSVVVAPGKTLTVGAGQVVKSYRYQSYEITVNGTLLANGTVNNPIVFTSTDDDSAGGDTNNNAAGSGPAQGQWNGIVFSATSTGSVLDRVEVRYGAANTLGAIVVTGAPLTLSNSVISNSYRAGVRIDGATPTLTGNTFANNGVTAIAMDLASRPVISGSTLTNNGVNGVALDGGTINANNNWNNPSISYWMTGNVTVAAGKTLTVGAGQVIKAYRFQGVELAVNGTLLVNGTAGAPVVFTTTEDDSVGGDTNNNLANSGPAAGQWNGITFSATSTGSVIDHAEVRYGGGNTLGAIVVTGAPLLLTNSTISDSYRTGVRIEGASPTLTGNTFARNLHSAIHMDMVSTPIITGSTLTSNGANGAVLEGGAISVNTTWNNPSIPYWLSGSVIVAPAKTLTIGAGQVIKWYRYASFELTINGTLLAK